MKTMIFIPHIWARRNFCASTHAKQTAFQVKIALALRAASTASCHKSNLTKASASFAWLPTWLYRTRAASNNPSTKHWSPTVLGLATLGAARNSSLSASFFVYTAKNIRRKIIELKIKRKPWQSSREAHCPRLHPWSWIEPFEWIWPAHRSRC